MAASYARWKFAGFGVATSGVDGDESSASVVFCSVAAAVGALLAVAGCVSTSTVRLPEPSTGAVLSTPAGAQSCVDADPTVPSPVSPAVTQPRGPWCRSTRGRPRSGVSGRTATSRFGCVAEAMTQCAALQRSTSAAASSCSGVPQRAQTTGSSSPAGPGWCGGAGVEVDGAGVQRDLAVVITLSQLHDGHDRVGGVDMPEAGRSEGMGSEWTGLAECLVAVGGLSMLPP